MSATVRCIPDANKLFVGEGVTIKGAVVLAETIVVDGMLEGDIKVDNLIINKTGTISGRIAVAGNAEINGQVLEKLDVKGLLVLRAGGRVNGNVSFGTLTIEQGATITGEVSSTDYRTNQQSDLSRQSSDSQDRYQKRNATGQRRLRPCRQLTCRCWT